MTDGASVRTEDRDGVVVASIVGEVDLSNADRISERLARAIPNAAAGLVIDLSETTYLDSSGVSLVFDLAERLQARQQRVRVAVPEDAPLRRVLRVVNLGSVVPIVVSADAAADEIRREA
jgi:anti-anti-sigma factor